MIYRIQQEREEMLAKERRIEHLKHEFNKLLMKNDHLKFLRDFYPARFF